CPTVRKSSSLSPARAHGSVNSRSHFSNRCINRIIKAKPKEGLAPSMSTSLSSRSTVHWLNHRLERRSAQGRKDERFRVSFHSRKPKRYQLRSGPQLSRWAENDANED